MTPDTQDGALQIARDKVYCEGKRMRDTDPDIRT
jgi:hypothetical protein